MMFQARHYDAIARILRESMANAPVDGRAHAIVDSVRALFADMFAEDNARFNRERFADACEPNWWGDGDIGTNGKVGEK